MRKRFLITGVVLSAFVLAGNAAAHADSVSVPTQPSGSPSGTSAPDPGPPPTTVAEPGSYPHQPDCYLPPTSAVTITLNGRQMTVREGEVVDSHPIVSGETYWADANGDIAEVGRLEGLNSYEPYNLPVGAPMVTIDVKLPPSVCPPQKQPQNDPTMQPQQSCNSGGCQSPANSLPPAEDRPANVPPPPD